VGLLIAASSCGATEPDEIHTPPITYDGKNRVLRFDGRTDYATTGTAAFPFPTDAQTVAIWVRLAGAAPPTGDSGTGADGVETIVTLRKDFDSGLALGLRDGAYEVWSVYSKRTFVRAPAPAKKNVWQYVAYTFDGSTHRMYLDGQPAGDGQTTPNNRTPTTAWLGSGDGSTAFFFGEMDEVRVYAVALTDPIIQAQAARGRVRETALEQPDDLVLWLGFDEVAGYRALDRSSRRNDALLGDGVAASMPERVLAEP
jgi:hypothetical protein